MQKKFIDRFGKCRYYQTKDLAFANICIYPSIYEVISS